MQPFDALTPRGQIGRVRAVARAALAQYGLGDARVSLRAQHFNTLFRVVDRDGRQFALRVGAAERVHPPRTESVEAAWMRALRRDTDIELALSIANAAGSFVTHATAPGVPGARLCTLFEWARGRRLSDSVDGPALRTMGGLLACLHEHGAQFDGGRPQPVMSGERVLTFAIPDRIPRTDARFGTLFADALDRAQQTLDALWANPPHAPHLLHGDLTPNNVLRWRQRLVPIDFQDLLWGFEIQDISFIAVALERDAVRDELLAQLRAGYEQLRPWPVVDAAVLRDLAAARRLNMLNLGFNLRRPGFDAKVERHAAWLRAWIDTK